MLWCDYSRRCLTWFLRLYAFIFRDWPVCMLVGDNILLPNASAVSACTLYIGISPLSVWLTPFCSTLKWLGLQYRDIGLHRKCSRVTLQTVDLPMEDCCVSYTMNIIHWWAICRWAICRWAICLYVILHPNKSHLVCECDSCMLS